MSMFGHNPFSWVDLRAETILNFKSEGGGPRWRSIPDSLDTAPAGYNDWTHQDNGWVADPCEASFFLWKGTGDQIGIAYPMSSNYNTGTWWIPPAVMSNPSGSPIGGSVAGGATSMVVNGYQAGEPYIDAYTRVMKIVGNWSGSDEGFEANYPGEVSVAAIPTITTIARPAFGLAKWTWISSVSDVPTDCGTMNTTEDCAYSNWSEWSVCDKNREADHPGGYDGTQTRTRTITSANKDCDGELTQTQDCVSPQPCEWSEWSEWTYPGGQSWASSRGICGFNNDDIGQVITRTRTRSVINAHQGGSEEDLCPEGLTETGWRSTQTETETIPCPTSASDCEDGEIWRIRMQIQEDGTRVESGKCVPCPQNSDPNANEDEYGCKSGCKSGFTDINMGITTNCHKVGCTDPLAKNYDSTATLSCNEPSMYGGGYDYNKSYGVNKDKFPPNRCCEYDCDNPLLKTDGQGRCTNECIDGYEMDSAGNCIEQCNEGFELIDGECKKSPKKDEKKQITTQSDDVSAIEPVKTDNKIPVVVGGIAVLGLLGTLMMYRKK